MRSVYNLLFVEEYREARRKRLGRSKLADIFYYSGVYDYRVLRYLINFPIGFFISFALYKFAWHRVNFADFDPLYKQIFMWSVIFTCALTFALSPVFRCAIVCVLCGALGKNGQGLLSVIVFTHLSDGPVNNIIANFNLSSHIITCHLKLKEQMMTERIVMSTGPIEALLAQKFGKSTTKGRKMIHMLKALVEPVAYDLTLSDEDKALAATIDNAEVLQIRDEMLNEKKERKSASSDEHVRPIWDKMKSKLAFMSSIERFQMSIRGYALAFGYILQSSKLLTMRLRFECSEIFDKGIKKCHDKFRDMKDKCYRLLWYMPFIKRNLCGRFDVLQICQASEKHAEAAKFCDEMMQQTMATTKNFDYDTENMKNITEEVMDHLRINVRFFYTFPILFHKHRLQFQVIFKTLKNLLGCLFILLLYTIFRDSVQMIRRYLNNVDFQNVFLTPYFWHIDKKREEAGQIFLRPLSKAERRVNGLLKPFSFVMRFSATSVTGQGKQRFHLEVAGTGFVADLVKDMINFEFDRAINLTVPAEHCQAQPIPPDWSFSWKYVLLPLILMLLLQVIFGYFIKRITLFYVIGGIFRKRNKARTIQLYNKLLFGRVNGRRLARARIRYQVERHILQQEAIKERRFANIPVMRREQSTICSQQANVFCAK
ncbi:unnamed protein product [Toxocara canis]|uniref:DC_STAMP domain-containing protein n=1 Tax=Toxocara canis TaxID=6265 RepID=A0A183UTV3_TOXCA|nr:unnamed protein product [Toxocara canis]